MKGSLRTRHYQHTKVASWTNLSLLLLSALFSFLLAEFGFRMILFSDIPGFDNLRNPSLYADSDSDDDFFKLRYIFSRWHGSQKHPPHPILGWIGDLPSDSLVHNDTKSIQGRRPVLLYGDSFARCVSPGVLCFQHILNSDQEFSKHHYLLNYGMSGYGVDQIYLLFHNTVHLYDDPFVVVSMMTLDLDRNVLTMRDQPKPYFRIEDEQLQLRGTPVTLTQEEFVSANPPQIRSYLFRRVLFSGHFPKQIRSFLRSESRTIEQKKAVSKEIILEIVNELEANNIDYVFVIFHPHVPGLSTLDSESDWRDPWLRKLLDDNQVPYIWSKDLFRQDTGDDEPSFDRYIIPNDGHPTTHFNELISQEIKGVVLESR